MTTPLDTDHRPGRPEPPRARRRVRGFVIIIVLAIAAVIAAIVSTQLLSGQQMQTVSIRTGEEVKARGIAETCLGMLSAYVDNFDTTPDPGDDYDAILAGADAIAGNGDDFVPFGLRLVTIPDSGGGAAAPFHRWELIDIPGS